MLVSGWFLHRGDATAFLCLFFCDEVRLSLRLLPTWCFTREIRDVTDIPFFSYLHYNVNLQLFCQRTSTGISKALDGEAFYGTDIYSEDQVEVLCSLSWLSGAIFSNSRIVLFSCKSPCFKLVTFRGVRLFHICLEKCSRYFAVTCVMC